MTEIELRGQMIEVCRRLYARNMLAAADGNVSVRLNADYILITPSGRPKAFIEPGDLAVVRLDGQVFSGKPSGERDMHLEIYRSCALAKAVVHAHPPHAIAWSLARPRDKELPNDRISEMILGVGRVPIVDYQRPGTADMGHALRPYLPECRALVLARHGAVTWGEDLEEAMNGMERIEHSSQILTIAETLGGATPLPADEIRALSEMRRKGGERLL